MRCFMPLPKSSSALTRSVAAWTDGLYDVIESTRVFREFSNRSNWFWRMVFIAIVKSKCEVNKVGKVW